MKKLIALFKKEVMLSVALLAAIAALIITPPTTALIGQIDWHTLGTLFMMLTVLEGFKQEDLFRPLLNLAGRITTMRGLSFFLVFCVFFSSMFVTNDVSLIIFVPLTIMLFRAAGKEHYILPVISMENIAAIRGSLLTPFGSPQNLFLYAQSGISTPDFLLMMAPLWVSSAILLAIFICFLYRKDSRESAIPTTASSSAATASTCAATTGPASAATGPATPTWQPGRRKLRLMYLLLFVIILYTVVSRTQYWPVAVGIVVLSTLVMDRHILRKTDYVLLLTFLCFFVFSSSICANSAISGFLTSSVAGHEYAWSILLSQVISNVPASIVLWPFTDNLKALIYGLDTAGLCSLIGSLASVINYRIYVREYPGKGGKFVKTFTLVSWIFFLIVVIPGYLLSR